MKPGQKITYVKPHWTYRTDKPITLRKHVVALNHRGGEVHFWMYEECLLFCMWDMS